MKIEAEKKYAAGTYSRNQKAIIFDNAYSRFLTKRKPKSKVLVFLLCTVLSLSFWGHNSFAQTVDELKDRKTSLQTKLQEIDDKIKSYQKQIADTQKQQASLRNELNIYDNQAASIELQIQAKQTQIEDSNLQIAELEKLIAQKNKDISENKKVLAELLVELHHYDSDYALKTVFASENFSEFLDQIQYTQDFQEKIYQLLQKIKDLKTQMETQQAELQAQVDELTRLKAELEATRQELENQRQQKQSLLDRTRGLERNYQKLLTASKSEEDELQKEIDDLDASIRAKLGNRTISPAKGILAWPMDGILTQGYGNTGFTKLGYTFHNGIDIAAPPGQPIYAATDGTVIAADTGQAAYGNWAAVKSAIATKNGMRQIVALYTHMRSFKVKVGQELKQGDLIGYEGNTGNTTRLLYGPERGYHLHFTIFDAEGFGVADGKQTKIYGRYAVPYGYTYNPLDFLR